MKTTTAQFINPTRCTAHSRQLLKHTLAAVKVGLIRVWGSQGSYKVTVSKNPSNAYTSCAFESPELAVRHLFKTAASTGFDMAKFDSLAARYFSRFGFPLN